MRMSAKTSNLAASALTAALIAGTSMPHEARACGGLFCGSAAPVVQTGEGIIFTVDEETQQVQAIINIRYQGAANEFAWVLPLQSVPTRVRVAPTFVFQVVDRLTAPR